MEYLTRVFPDETEFFDLKDASPRFDENAFYRQDRISPTCKKPRAAGASST